MFMLLLYSLVLRFVIFANRLSAIATIVCIIIKRPTAVSKSAFFAAVLFIAEFLLVLINKISLLTLAIALIFVIIHIIAEKKAQKN